MCNIAGYVGERDAAPILIEMIKTQEGYAGGYYTGIATLHEGKLYYEKLTGDTDHLLSLTKAAKLPGRIGIIHSRSKSGGGDEWAHPFIGSQNAAPFCAYVANGSVGYYKERIGEFNAIAQALVDEGYPLACMQKDPPAYVQLKDGSSAHMSDIMCQLILRRMQKGAEPANAMEGAFCEMPSEIVGLLLTLDKPDCITYARFNMPMSVGFAPHGAYLSSSPHAIPADAGEPTLLLANSCGYIYRDRFCTVPMQAPPTRVLPITAERSTRVYNAVKEALTAREMTFGELKKQVVTPLFGEEGIWQVAALTYQVLLSLRQQGLLKERIEAYPGVFPGLTAPKVKLWI